MEYCRRADPGTQRPEDDDRAVGLLVLPGDGGQQAAGGQAGGVRGADAGGRLALSGAVADAGAAGLAVTGPGRGGDFLADPDRRQPDLDGAGQAHAGTGVAGGQQRGPVVQAELFDPDPAEQVILTDPVQEGRMVGGHVPTDHPDHLIIVIASGDEPALASDELHSRISSPGCSPSVMPGC